MPKVGSAPLASNKTKRAIETRQILFLVEKREVFIKAWNKPRLFTYYQNFLYFADLVCSMNGKQISSSTLSIDAKQWQ